MKNSHASNLQSIGEAHVNRRLHGSRRTNKTVSADASVNEAAVRRFAIPLTSQKRVRCITADYDMTEVR